MKKIIFLLATLSVYFDLFSNDQYTHYLWVDNSSNPIIYNDKNIESFIDMSSLDDGLHVLKHVAILPDSTITPPMQSYFIKYGSFVNNHINCHVHIDNNITKYLDCSFKNGVAEFEMDMSDIPEGFHSLVIDLILEGSKTVISSTTSYFVKTALIGDGQNLNCYAIVDNDKSKRYSCSPQDNGMIHFDLDMTDLTNGLHQLTIYLTSDEDNTIISPFSAFFIKLPEGGSAISNYCYWFNNDTENCKNIQLPSPVTPYNLMSLLEADVYPLQTSSFDFGTEGEDVIMTSRNNFNLWAMDNSGRFSQTITQSYSDPRSIRRIKANEIELLSSCEYKSVGKIENNDIKWYRFEGEIGDSVAINLTQNAMYEVFSPTGEKIIAKKGAAAQSISTCTLLEKGAYYLSLHDIASPNKSSLKLNFNHIPRNSILSVTPSTISNKSKVAVLDIFGNGLDEVTEIKIDNGSGTCIPLQINSLLNKYNGAYVLNISEDMPLGSYSIIAKVKNRLSGEEQEIRKDNILSILDTVSKSKLKVEVIPSKKASTPYMVDITITNDSDIPCWGIPFNIACERDGGTNGYIFYMRDLLGYDVDLEHIPWYESDNILGTGVDGLYFPLILTYLQPHEKRTLKVGVISEAHKKVGLYAWAGTPYNEEIQTILGTPKDSLNSMPIAYSNLLDLKTVAYISTALNEFNNKREYPIHRAPSNDNRVLEFMRDYGPDIVGCYEPLEGPTNYADRAAKIAQGIGEAGAGIVNSGAAMHSYIALENLHIPGATLSEKLHNVDLMYGGFENIGPEAADLKYYYLQGKAELARAKSPEDIFDDAFDTPEWAKYLRGFIRRNANSSNPMPLRHELECFIAYDPNMITGYTDPCGGPYIGLDIDKIYYTVEFENDPELANASASYVCVENRLDSYIFDTESFETTKIEIGQRTIDLPTGQNFVTTVDMRPDIQCLVEVKQNFDIESGTIKWSFTSLDPISLDPVDNYLQGFLPVNSDTKSGIGTITYAIKLKEGIAHGLTFSNSASIIFDDNSPVITPEWKNTTDYSPPRARIVNIYEYNGECYAFDVECEDQGSGIAYYDLYVQSSNSKEWYLAMARQTESHIEFSTPEELANAKFAVVAVDKAGNRQNISSLNALLGDADGNGLIDTNDIEIVRSYYLDKSIMIIHENADVNFDGVIDVQDVIAIRNICMSQKEKSKQ